MQESLLAKNTIVPTDLDLSWDVSCLVSADDYSIHEGTIGTWYSHSRAVCTTGGSTSHTMTPGSGGRYFLVVPLNPDAEGSYGLDSSGTQRPLSSATCRSEVSVEPCP